MKTEYVVLGIAVVLCAVFFAIFYAYFVAGPGFIGGPPPVVPDGREIVGPPVEVSQEDLQSLFNTGIAGLENAKYDEGIRAFAAFHEAAPQNEPGLRNLALAKVLAVGAMDRFKDEAAFIAAQSEAQKTVEALLAMDAQSVPALRIGAELARLGEDRAKQQEYLNRAATAAPDNASVQFAIAEIGLETQDAALAAPTLAALLQAHAQAPENLWVLIQLLQQLASAKDTRVVEIANAAQGAFVSVKQGVQERANVDVSVILTKIAEFAASGKWVPGPDAPGQNNVATQVRILGNVTKSEDAAQSDLLRIKGHPLDFASIQSGLPMIASTAETKTEWKFTPLEIELPQGAVDAKLHDFNLDGRPDVCLLADGRVTIFTQAAPVDGILKFESTTQVDAPGAAGIVLADFDDDASVPLAQVAGEAANVPNCHRADLDVIAFGPQGTKVFRNDLDASTGQRTLSLVEAFETPEGPAARKVAVADLDMDGDLDLLVGSESGGLQQYSNRGNLSFRMKEGSPAGVPEGFVLASAVGVDLDRDIDLDVVVADESGRVGFLENLRHGSLRWRALEVGAAEKKFSTVNVLDADRSAAWDVVASGPSGAMLLTGRNPQAGDIDFEPNEPLSALDVPAASVADLDNDGVEELIAVGQDCLWVQPLGVARSTMQPIWSGSGAVTDLQTGDLDNDGDLDVMALAEGQARLLRNETPTNNQWLDVMLVGEIVEGPNAVSARRVNHYGRGALLEIRAGADYQARVMQGDSVHFGLGTKDKVDSVRIIWPNGIPSHVVNPDPKAYLCEKQVLHGSCPFLYAWNGERFEFVTDLLWAAPLGLPSSGGGLTPYREWEYLKIPGEMLRAQGNRYVLQMTEELREAGYFDEVQLYAVDHPADVEIFTNEKVGPASVAEHRIHTVRERRVPVKATNGQGQDLLPLVKARDGEYAQPYERVVVQGLTTGGALELDLGALGDDPRVTLFLTGWLFPPDAGVSVGLQENPDLPGASPPSLWVPDDKGEWNEVIPYTGFPGGKPKTIAIDLTGVLNAKDPRLQIRTTMQLCWDEAFFTLNEEPAEFVETRLEMTSADLHYRGFSAIRFPGKLGPEWFDYSDCDPTPKYQKMRGKFTRYGDVLALLGSWDDRMVVIAPGDEMTLEWTVPADSMPEGWIRDFVVYNVGWDKDAQLHTIYGQSSEPMPYRAMPSYPYLDGYPTDASVQDYLKEYQTREMPDVGYRQALRRGRN